MLHRPEPVTPTLDHAWENMRRLLSEAGLEDFVLTRANVDASRGAWPFEVKWPEKNGGPKDGKEKYAFVWMPGLPLAQLKVPQREVTYFVPKIIVNGNDWLWPHAMHEFQEEEQ